MSNFNVESAEYSEDVVRDAVDQISGFKRCKLSPPISIGYVSQGFTDIVGYTAEELHEFFNDESVRFVHPDDAEEYRKLLQKFSLNEMTATFHYRVICKNGQVKTLTDTMKSVRIDDEMWGFSCVSDTTSVDVDTQLASILLHSDNTVLSLLFDLDTGRRITSSADVAPVSVPNDITLDTVVGNIRMRVGPHYTKRFEEFANSWHLRERLSMECLMLGPINGEDQKYRCVRFSTVCLPDNQGRRIFGITIVDIEQEKQHEVLIDKRGGADWLTGLSNFAHFHEQCMEKGLSGNAAVLSGEGDANAVSLLYSDEFSVLAAAREAETLRKSRKAGGKICVFAAIWISLNMVPESGSALHDRWHKIKRVAATLRIVSRDDAVIARADGPLFMLFSPSAEKLEEALSRVRLFIAGIDSQFDDEIHTNIGIALVKTGDDYDKALATAFSALDEAISKKGSAAVVKDLQGVSYDAESGIELAGVDDAITGDVSSEFEEEERRNHEAASLLDAATARDDQASSRVRIRTFGYFEVYVDGQVVMFSSTKAKELLALLVDHNGGYVTPSFAISRLWETESCNSTTRARYRKVALKLRRTLEEYGVVDILDEKNGNRRIVPELVDCDLFRFKEPDCPPSQRFRGLYLPDYPWGELTLAQLLYESSN